MSSQKSRIFTLLAATLGVAAQSYSATYDPANLPPTTEGDQVGTNQCGTGNNDTSMCQNIYLNSVQDFCLWGPHDTAEIGAVEQTVVSYCTHPNRGTRLFHNGTIISAHFVETPDYVQITGTGNFQGIHVAAGDAGGELDPHGADGAGNPHGGLVFSNIWTSGSNGLGQQIHEWTNFMSVSEYCIRVCKPGGRDVQFCGHEWDVTGCHWNMPGDYGPGFTECKGESGDPMGLYPQADGTTSTFHQGQPVTPPAHPAPSTSACKTYESASLYAAEAFATTTSISIQGQPTATSSMPRATQANGAGSLQVSSFGAMPCLIASTLLAVLAATSILV